MTANLNSSKSFFPTAWWPSWNHFQHIKSHRLWQWPVKGNNTLILINEKKILGTEDDHNTCYWPALANSYMVTLLHTEARGNVSWNIWMPLLIPNKIKVRHFETEHRKRAKGQHIFTSGISWHSASSCVERWWSSPFSHCGKYQQEYGP